MGEIDLKDRKILFELDLDCRQSDSEIARKVRLSRDSVRYRIRRLQEEGYINYFMIILNSMKLGFQWYRTFFKFQNLSLEKEQEIIGWLKGRASWITKVEGRWDLNTGIFCRNVYEYRDIIGEFLGRYSAHVARYDVAIVTREWTYHKDYLLGKKQKTSTPILMGYSPGEEYTTEQLDKTDYRLLEALLKDGRAKTVDLARRLGTTEMVVRYRMKKLVERGIIIGFVPFLDVRRLGYRYFKLHVTLQNATSERKRALLERIHAHPATVHMTELVGGADLECEFQVKGNEEFYGHVEELRKQFGDMIRDYEFLEYVKEYKFTYLPEMY